MPNKLLFYVILRQKENYTIHKDIIFFLFVDIFIIRIGQNDDDNGTRYLSFKRLVATACEEIKKGNYE